ncbi:MAG: malate dehydrogenase [Candidatus Omnitrophica bacterium]|nr:malate dehydrogenase [Candidatus Omnitrophota bacterium]
MIKKVSVIGSGAVGSTLAFHLLRLNLKELTLVDTASDLARGVALDLEDTRAFFNFPTDIKAGGDFSLIKDSDIVVITAGVARKEGMSRLDLLKINANVAKEVSAEIKKYAKGAIVIAVTNPLDIITYIITRETGFARSKICGMGSSLDSARLLNIFSLSAGVSAASLEGFVFGLHNNEMIVSAQRLKVKGEPLENVLTPEKIEKLRQRTAMRGGEIVGLLKNRSASFAPSLSCFRLIEAIAYDKNEIIPVSVLLSGEYGLNGVCMGVPCLINASGVDRIIEIKLTTEEKEKIKKVKDTFAEIDKLL